MYLDFLWFGEWESFYFLLCPAVPERQSRFWRYRMWSYLKLNLCLEWLANFKFVQCCPFYTPSWLFWFCDYKYEPLGQKREEVHPEGRENIQSAAGLCLWHNSFWNHTRNYPWQVRSFWKHHKVTHLREGLGD